MATSLQPGQWEVTGGTVKTPSVVATNRPNNPVPPATQAQLESSTTITNSQTGLPADNPADSGEDYFPEFALRDYSPLQNNMERNGGMGTGLWLSEGVGTPTVEIDNSSPSTVLPSENKTSNWPLYFSAAGFFLTLLLFSMRRK